MLAACSISFLKTINYIEAQKCLFGINGLILSITRHLSPPPPPHPFRPLPSHQPAAALLPPEDAAPDGDQHSLCPPGGRPRHRPGPGHPARPRQLPPVPVAGVPAAGHGLLVLPSPRGDDDTVRQDLHHGQEHHTEGTLPTE